MASVSMAAAASPPCAALRYSSIPFALLAVLQMMDWRAFRAEGMDDRLQSWVADKRKREEHLERMLRLRDIHRPAHLRRRKQKVKRVQQSEEQTPAIV